MPMWSLEDLDHTCIGAVGQLCDHNSPACGQFCRSSLWASVTYIISAYGTITHYTLLAQPYIYIYIYMIWYLVEMRKVEMAVGASSTTITDWQIVQNQFLGHLLFKIGHIPLSMVILVNKMHISRKSLIPLSTTFKSVYQVHTGMSAHDFITVLRFAIY